MIAGGEHDDVAGIFCEIFVDRCYTPARFYCPRAGDVVLDIGANIGLFSLHLCSLTTGVVVHAFEPHPETFTQLSANLSANKIAATVTAHRLAVGQSAGTVYFAPSSTGDFGHVATIKESTGTSAEMITLADALRLTGASDVELLKVDTEGAEVEIVAGATDEIWRRIRRVVVEYHSLEKCDAVLASLRRHYRCRVVPAPGFEHHLGLIYATERPQS